MVANVSQSGGEGYTRKAILLLPIVIQLTYLVLCEGVGANVGVGVGKVCGDRDGVVAQASMFRLDSVCS